MSYKPLQTAMERITILTNLRKQNISFPEDFKRAGYEKQEILIKWALALTIRRRLNITTLILNLFPLPF